MLMYFLQDARVLELGPTKGRSISISFEVRRARADRSAKCRPEVVETSPRKSKRYSTYQISQKLRQRTFSQKDDKQSGLFVLLRPHLNDFDVEVRFL